MASRTLHLSLTSVFASLLLVCAAGETLASSRAAVQGAGLTMAVTASTEPLACDSDGGTTCFDIATNDPNINITHIFVDSGCTASPSDFFITVGGAIITELQTNGGPCESIPRDVWFPLPGNQDTAFVCVSVPGAGPEDIQVYAKAGDECIVGTMP